MTSTLGALIDRGYTVRAYCHRCDRRAALDLDALASRFGAAAPVRGAIGGEPPRIAGRALRCSDPGCRSLNTSIRISPGGLPSGRL